MVSIPSMRKKQNPFETLFECHFKLLFLLGSREKMAIKPFEMHQRNPLI